MGNFDKFAGRSELVNEVSKGHSIFYRKGVRWGIFVVVWAVGMCVPILTKKK